MHPGFKPSVQYLVLCTFFFLTLISTFKWPELIRCLFRRQVKHEAAGIGKSGFNGLSANLFLLA